MKDIGFLVAVRVREEHGSINPTREKLMPWAFIVKNKREANRSGNLYFQKGF